MAGVMSVDDALGLVGARGRLMFDLPRGVMLSVRAPADQIAAKLGPEVAIASINAPSLCVVAGPEAAVAETQARASRPRGSHASRSSRPTPSTRR